MVNDASAVRTAIVVGAGMAGLACAIRLHRAGVGVRVIEAADRAGGRVATDVIEGPGGEYLVDRGFQVYLTAYPEASGLLDHGALRLRAFTPGAVCHTPDGARSVIDPLRDPIEFVGSLFSTVPTAMDALRLGMLDRAIRSGDPQSLWDRPDISTIDAFRQHDLSDRVIDQFLRPFFGGVFFDPDLVTSARMFAYTYRMFATGQTAVPERGMGQIAHQLVAMLPEGAVSLNTRASGVDAHSVTLESGERLEADAVVVATDASSAAAMLGDAAPARLADAAWMPTVTLALTAPERGPIEKPILHLDGYGPSGDDDARPVNHLAVMSAVSRGYAPAGRSLIYANLVGDHARRAMDAQDGALFARVSAQVGPWLEVDPSAMELLTMVRVPRALPAQPVGWLEPPARPTRLGSGVHVCGDWLENASINGAMRSGRRAAEGVLGLAPA